MYVSEYGASWLCMRDAPAPADSDARDIYIYIYIYAPAPADSDATRAEHSIWSTLPPLSSTYKGVASI